MPRVGIIGAGAMGGGIAQVAATAGWEVQLYDINAEQLDKSLDFIKKMLNRSVEKGRIDDVECKAILGRLYVTQNFSAFANCDLVIEAVVEDLQVKKSLFKKVEKEVSSDCILATNTSSLSVASIASACDDPSRVCGIHFFNPPVLMKLVEIIPAVQTNSETLAKADQIISSWGKLTVKAKDTPGFIVNRVARPFYGEGLRIYEEGIAEPSFIDRAMTEIGEFRMGPFTLMDYIGHDVNYKVTCSVFEAFYWDPRYKPSFAQKALVDAGYLGRKTGRGFYNYTQEESPQEMDWDASLAQEIVDRIVVMLINEAADAVFWNIATSKDIDLAMTRGVNYPKGLLAWANEIGISRVVSQLDQLYDTYREDRYRCSPLLRTMARKGSQFEL